MKSYDTTSYLMKGSKTLWARRCNSNILPFRITGIKHTLPISYNYKYSSNNKFLDFYDHKIFNRSLINEDLFINILEEIQNIYVVSYKKKYYLAGKGFLATYPGTGFNYSSESGWDNQPLTILYLATLPKNVGYLNNSSINFLKEYVDKSIMLDEKYKDIKKIIDRLVGESLYPIIYTTNLQSIIEEVLQVPTFLSIADKKNKISIMLNNFVEDVIKTA